MNCSYRGNAGNLGQGAEEVETGLVGEVERIGEHDD